ncbi:MAG: enoyl-ACP reductase FabI [Paracoccus sp. (in: a-proteobacteria)]|nr:enoyl-ACP reductase FabI [Paracoccus sp. (in: a-proteobacteria)]
MSALEGRVALIVGVANGHSIAAGCAQAMSDAGAQLALTYLNDRARPFVQPVADAVGAQLLLPLDVQVDDQMQAVFEAVRAKWGRLDILVHSIAYCPADDLHGRVTDSSRAGFAQAMDISVHSLIRMARLAEPLMAKGGSIMTMTYYGGEKVVDHYNIMGPVKAALEATVRSLAVELGPRQIRVNALSPGPLQTRAGSGIAHFDLLIDAARLRAPAHSLVTVHDVGQVAVMLASDGARGVSGDITYVDGGLHVRA